MRWPADRRVVGLLAALAAAAAIAGCDAGTVSGDGSDDSSDDSSDDGATDDAADGSADDDGAGDSSDDGATDGDDDGDGPPSDLTLDERECPEESFLTYQNFGSGFFSEYCTGCHSAQLPPGMRQGAPEGVDFETLAKVRELAPLIYLRAADGYSLMPPVGGPSSEGRELLGEWLACGAPE